MMAILAAPFVAPGCGGSGDRPKGSGGGDSGAGAGGAGTAGTGESKGGSSSGSAGRGGASGSGNATSGGSSGEAGRGESGSGASGVAGTGPNGSSGDAGAGGSAGTGTTGEAGQGGEAGHAGANAAGAGGGSSGVVGVVGTPCSSPGALACAGNHQKLTVFCDGDGEWEANETCGAGEFCDSTPGENAGTCQPELPECADGPGTKFCVADKELVTCSADAVTTATEVCEQACHQGACVERSECPTWNDYNFAMACSHDCGDPGPDYCLVNQFGCTEALVAADAGERAVVRTGWADEMCLGCDGTSPEFRVTVVSNSQYGHRITVPPPWRVQAERQCDAGSDCAVSRYGTFILIASSPSDGPVNVVIEGLAAPGTCGPPDTGEGGAGGAVGEAGSAGNVF